MTLGVGRAELGGGGGGGSKQLKIPSGGGIGRGCKIFLIYFLEGGGGCGQPRNPSGYMYAPLMTMMMRTCRFHWWRKPDRVPRENH